MSNNWRDYGFFGVLGVQTSDVNPITIHFFVPQVEPGTVGQKVFFIFGTQNFGAKFKISTHFEIVVTAEIFIAIDRQKNKYVNVQVSAESIQPFSSYSSSKMPKIEQMTKIAFFAKTWGKILGGVRIVVRFCWNLVSGVFWVANSDSDGLEVVTRRWLVETESGQICHFEGFCAITHVIENQSEQNLQV